MEFRSKWQRLACIFTFSVLINTAFAAPGSAIAGRELQRQQQRQQAVEEQLQPQAPDVRLLPKLEPIQTATEPEKVCFVVREISLQGGDTLPLQKKAREKLSSSIDQCLGLNGIRQLVTDLQNMWIAEGLVTTRVLVPPQDLSTGRLALTVIPGVFRNISATENSRINLKTAIPAKEGAPLDLRDFEQGLENLQRLPSVSANFRIVPGDKPGESNVEIDWQQDKLWRVALSANDSGSDSTGRNQATTTLYVDNLLGLSDLIYFSRGVDLHHSNRRGSDSYTGHFSLPLGYWNIGFTTNGYDYVQTVAGLNNNIEYSGSSRNQSLELSRIVHRSNRSKTTVKLAVGKRQSRNYIEDVEVGIQRRETAFWKLGVNNRFFFDTATLSSDLSYRKGTRWFGALPAPEESIGEATALSDIVNVSASLQVPFHFSEQRFRWNPRFYGQWTDTPLTPQDQMTIGSRYTVRGFDGQVSLAADKGWYLQNDFAWLIPGTQSELYWGLDYGSVSGNGVENLLGNHLAGTVLGLKGNWRGISYQLFAGKPLSKPSGFKADDHTLGFSVNWEY